MTREPVYVTRTYLPDFEKYSDYVRYIFTARQLTNRGKLSRDLEARLEEYLHVPHVGVCANGTLALQLGLHVAGLAGKTVITTPFTYAATLSALIWEGCNVVFADIDEETCCLDPESVAALLTQGTAGILPVHIYGNCCDVEAFDELARAHNLVIFYDAAQAFGSQYLGKSLLAYGDLAAASMHATNIFHSAEGGFLVTHDKADHDSFTIMRACGHMGDDHIRPGLNAKLSELHAAMGLCMLDTVETNIAGRKEVSLWYDDLLPSTRLRRPVLREGLKYNYAYYPVIFEDGGTLIKAMSGLHKENIRPRRYFRPALNTLPYLKQKYSCPVAEKISQRVLCLPLSAEMERETVERIADIVRKTL